MRASGTIAAWGTAALLLAFGTSAASAQQAVTLPGGASALTETHENWIVRCGINLQAVACAVQQEQLDSNTRQRVLAIELTPVEGSLRGTLVLPFGLSLDNGVLLQIDDQQPLPALRFRTCLPAGCLIDIALTPESITALRTAAALKITATADGGAAAPFSLPLGGFSSAYDRAVSLAAQ